MRMPRFRFTVRRMMLAVAVLSVPLSFIGCLARFERQQAVIRRAYTHKDQAFKIWCYPLEPVLRDIPGEEIAFASGDSPDVSMFRTARWATLKERSSPEWRVTLEQVRKRFEYHKAMQVKWERAMAASWPTVDPDPPAPPCDHAFGSFTKNFR